MSIKTNNASEATDAMMKKVLEVPSSIKHQVLVIALILGLAN